MAEETGGGFKAFALSTLALFATLIAVIGLWIVNLRLGPPIEGFGGGPMLAVVPLLLLSLGIVWIAIRLGMRRNMVWNNLTVTSGALGFGLVAVVSMCGTTACFVPGANRLLGWFVVLGIVAAALVHHLVYVRLSRGPAN